MEAALVAPSKPQAQEQAALVRALQKAVLDSFPAIEAGVYRATGLKEKARLTDLSAAVLAQVLLVALLRKGKGIPSWEGTASALLQGLAPSLLAEEAGLASVLEGLAEGLPPVSLKGEGEALEKAAGEAFARFCSLPLDRLESEALGEVYQNLVPAERRKALGEVYTPPSLASYVLQETLAPLRGKAPRILDPSCGSGIFLVEFLRWGAERGLSPQALHQGAWGFDINPYAAFLARIQVFWGLYRLGFGAKPNVHVLDSLQEGGLWGGEPGEGARDRGTWDAVVGNPPYVRTRRSDGSAGHLYGGNADLGVLFLQRITKGSRVGGRPWVRPGGRFGLVVSGGYASSAEAARVWRAFRPGGEYRLERLVWLEFAGSLWEANVVPMAVIGERRTPNPQDVVELWLPSSWPKEKPEPHELARLPYQDFFDPRVAPRFGAEEGFGDILLPLLRPEDVPLLRKLHPGGAYRTLGKVLRPLRRSKGVWGYGLPRGRVRPAMNGEGLPVYGGWALGVAAMADPDPRDRASQEDVALWRSWTEGLSEYLAVPKLAKSPFAVLVRGEAPRYLPLNTVLLASPPPGLGEAVALYLSSLLARWYWAVRFRAGIIRRHYSTLYARNLEYLPWPRNPSREILEALREVYGGMEALVAEAKAGGWTQERKEAFWSLEEEGNRLVFRLFGLTREEELLVRTRTATYPLSFLTPRYPWEVQAVEGAEEALEG